MVSLVHPLNRARLDRPCDSKSKSRSFLTFLNKLCFFFSKNSQSCYQIYEVFAYKISSYYLMKKNFFYSISKSVSIEQLIVSKQKNKKDRLMLQISFFFLKNFSQFESNLYHPINYIWLCCTNLLSCWERF